MNKYSSYESGLEIGDIVYYNINAKHFFVDNNKYSALVLDREFLYEQKTTYGLRRFFKYTFLGDLSGIKTQIPPNLVNEIFNIETKHIKVLKTIKSSKEKV